jgi:hypothetical protein
MIFLLALLEVFAQPSSMRGIPLKLQWNHDTKDTTHYRVYFGAEPGRRDTYIEVPLSEVEVLPVANGVLDPGVLEPEFQITWTHPPILTGTYYSSVTAVNKSEDLVLLEESEYSNEISFRVKELYVMQGTDFSGDYGDMKVIDVVYYIDHIADNRKFFSLKFPTQ